MAAGCRNPSAKNFDPTATLDNYTCSYLLKNQGNCHLFHDVTPNEDFNRSFTMSYSIARQSWVFFHDYQPDIYLHSREALFAASNSALFKINEGPVGVYLDQEVKKPFFIDVVFRADADLILETCNWVTEFLSGEGGTDDYFKTLTHISIWNSHQHSGRISLADVPPTLDKYVRKTAGQWSFDKFRDILTTKGPSFLLNIFKDYALDSTAVTPKMWYDKELLTDKWFCVRFEFDNSVNKVVQLRDTTIQALKSDR